MSLKQLLQQMIELKASDIFVIAGLPLSYQSSGIHVRTDGQPLMPADTERDVRAIYDLAGRDFARFDGNANHQEALQRRFAAEGM